jgi:hypothetical protein
VVCGHDDDGRPLNRTNTAADAGELDRDRFEPSETSWWLREHALSPRRVLESGVVQWCNRPEDMFDIHGPDPIPTG